MSKVYRARAKEWAIEQKPGAKAPQISIMFQVIGGEADGQHRTYYGSFSDAATDFTLNAMRACGWSTDSLFDLAGMDANEVNLVAEDETYEGKTREKIKWVNSIAALKVKNPMTSDQLRAFEAKMKGRIIATRQKNGGTSAPAQRSAAQSQAGGDDGAWPTDDDIPF